MSEGVMKLSLGWAELLLTGVVLLASLGGSYTITKVQIAENTVRLDERDKRDDRVYEVLDKFNNTLSDLNVTMGRVDERLKALEERGP